LLSVRRRGTLYYEVVKGLSGAILAMYILGNRLRVSFSPFGLIRRECHSCLGSLAPFSPIRQGMVCLRCSLWSLFSGRGGTIFSWVLSILQVTERGRGLGGGQRRGIGHSGEGQFQSLLCPDGCFGSCVQLDVL